MGGGGDDLKLLGAWTSPFSLRVRLALSLKGLDYEYLEEDLFNSKSELLLASNPVHKKVPVLIHNGRPICESSVILEYIDEAFAGVGPSLLPDDPYERAVDRFWAAFVNDKLEPLWFKATRAKTEEEKAEALKETLSAVDTLEAAFKERSKGKPFFGGDALGLVDVMLGGQVPWIHAGEAHYGLPLFDDTRSPLLAAWVGRLGALDVAKAVLPDVGKLVEFAKMGDARRAAEAADK